MIVTSRFPLGQLKSYTGYRELSLEDLDEAAARAVLRSWIGSGNDDVLDAVAKKVHRHALSVSVLGSFIAEFCDGDARAGLGLDLGEIAKEASEADAKAARLYRLIEHYAEQMPETERALMERLCMFPRGVTVDVLRLLVRAGGRIAGALEGSNQTRLVVLLGKLVGRGLVFGYGTGIKKVYTAHPFIRDAFRARALVSEKDVHEAVRQRLAPTLEERPGEPSGESNILDQYELLIEHTRLAGKIQEASDLYRFGMGGYEHLGRKLGDHARGVRVLSGFAIDEAPEHIAPELPVDMRGRLLTDWLLFAKTRGDLAIAARCSALCTSDQLKVTSAANIAVTLINDGSLAVNRGHLGTAAVRLKEALATARQSSDGERIALSYVTLAWIRHLAGRTRASRKDFAEASALAGARLSLLSGVWEAEAKLCCGDRDGARKQCESNLPVCQEENDNLSLCRLYTLLGELSLPEAPATARAYLDLTRTWTTRTGDMEVILRAHLLAAHLARVECNYELSLDEAEEGMILADTHGFRLYAIDLYSASARAHLDLENPSKAITLAEEARKRSAAPECGYAWGHADSLHLLGLAHKALGQIDDALRFFKQAANVRTRIEHPGAAESQAEAAALQAART